MEPLPRDLKKEIEKSRDEIAELHERVKALTARRAQREALAKKVQDSVTTKDLPNQEG